MKRNAHHPKPNLPTRREMPNPKAVNEYFADIAPEYDFANRVMSSGVDVLWRNYLARRVRALNPTQLLDLATGSGDVAFTLAKKVPSITHIVGLDFCEPMLVQAREKQPKHPRYTIIDFRNGDCLDLPFEDEQFDVVTISFGLRNLENRHKGLTEMKRVLKTNGRLFVLEFTQPDSWIRGLYYWYLKNVIPKISGKITGNQDAYQYLSSSIGGFPEKESLAEELEKAGFSGVSYKGLTFSIAAVHEGQKN